jgi:fibronectin type 3 domain-containing protein
MTQTNQSPQPRANFRWFTFVGRRIIAVLTLILALAANIAIAQLPFPSITVTNAYDVAANYTTFSGNNGYGFGPWALSTTGGSAMLANGGFMLTNNTANATSTATRAFNSPLTPSQSFSVMLQLGFLGDTDCEDGIQLQDVNGNVLFSYYHYGNEANANNGEYTDANGNGTANGFSYNYENWSTYTFVLLTPTTYLFIDNTSGASISGALNGAPIAKVVFFQSNGSAVPSNAQDFTFNNLMITTPTSPYNAATAYTNADTVYDGWVAAYVVNSNSTGTSYFVNTLTNRSEAYLWGEAYMIWGAEDAYYKNHGADRKAFVNSVLTHFISNNGTLWSWDTWNDDIAWSVIACVNGYLITNNPAFLNVATNNWNMAYARGWDNVFDGGVWELMDDRNEASGNKGGLSNWTTAIAACMIYEATSNAYYLTKAEQIYAWARCNCFNPATGAVYEGVGYDGMSDSDNVYNSGLIEQAASTLYRLTGKIGYYNDAMVVANHVIGNHNIMTVDYVNNGSFGGEQFYRGLSAFARQNNLWATYYPWLQNNCIAAWNSRRSDYNITWNDFLEPTTTNDVAGMEAESAQVVQATTQMTPIASLYATNLTAVVTNGEIALNWNIVAGATNYNLYRAYSTFGPFTKIAPALGTNSYTDADVSTCENYFYAVTVTNAGVEGFPSAAVAASLPGGALPAPWQNTDVGAVGVAGSASYCSGQFTLTGSGSDIWNGADAFQFVYVNLPTSTNCDIRAQVLSVANTSGFAKAAVMIRSSLAADSPQVTVDVTPGNGIEMLYRTETAGATYSINVAGQTAPNWIRLAQVSNVFTAYWSPDGSDWIPFGVITNLGMTTGVYVGLAVCAHDNAVLNTSLFDNVSINSQAPSIPTGLRAYSGYGAVNLSWSPAANATSYVVSRSTTSGAETMIATTTAANYGDVGLINGTKYYYVVQAQNATGQSSASSEVSGTPVSPPNGSYEAVVLTNHPVAYWPLNETNGTVAFDLVGGHNGTYVGNVSVGQPGISFTSGAPAVVTFSTPSYSPIFDGVSGYVDVPQGSGALNLTQALTMVAWVDLSVTPGNYSTKPENIFCLLGRGNSSWRMTVNNSGYLVGSDGAANVSGANTIVASGWHLVAYSYNGISGANNNGSLYVDGVMVARNTVTTPAGNANDLWLAGAPDYGTAQLFFGNLAHVAIFTNALPAAQLQALYTAAKTPDPVGLQVQGDYGQNVLNWSAMNGATNYLVERSTSSGLEAVIGSTTNEVYDDTAVVDGVTYYYVVIPQSVNVLMSQSVEKQGTPLPLPPTNSFMAAMLGAQPVACWQLNETGNPTTGNLTAYDYVGGYDGIYGNLAMNGNPLYDIVGPRPPAYPGFSPTNTALQTMRAASSGVTVPALNLSNTNATIVAWIYPTNTEGSSGTAIFVDRTGGTTAGFCYSSTLVNGGYPLGYIWNDNDSATWGWAGSGVFPPVNQWSLVALTVTASNATVGCWSSNKVQLGVFEFTNTNMTFDGNSEIGNDSAFANKNFMGRIGDVAVFNYAVSSNALQTLYVAAVNQPPVFLLNPFTLPGVVAGQAYSDTVATNANDPNGFPITFRKVGGPAWLNVAGNGGLSGTPLSSNVGINSFGVSATDIGGLTNTATMDLTVLPAPPLVVTAAMEENGLILNWGGGIGPYQVQWTTNLANPNWQNWGAVISTNSLLIPTTNSTTFYRIGGQ